MSNSIIWLTGPSTAGKTTLAKELIRELPYILLDGDEMRESISLGSGFSAEARTEHNLRVARLAKVLSRQTNVVVAVIAPLAEVRVAIDKICSPAWIYVKRTVPEREFHFYEEPAEEIAYDTIDMDTLSIDGAAEAIRDVLKLDTHPAPARDLDAVAITKIKGDGTVIRPYIAAHI